MKLKNKGLKDKFSLKLEELELNDLYKYIIDNNKGAINPYHNNYHLKSVCKFVIKGCKYYEIDKDKTKLVVSASLFHDFDHSGGKFKNDDDNIKLAINGFKKWSNLSEDDNKLIIELIKTTRYPYIKECTTKMEKIIRDSDILQGPFSKDYFNKIVYALADELKIDKAKMLEFQVNFLESTKFCTNWADSLYKEILEKTVKKVKKEIKKTKKIN